MSRDLFRAVLLAVVFCSFSLVSQVGSRSPQVKPQTARQALIEMITQGGDAIQKHLTVEVQNLLKSGKSVSAFAMLDIPRMPGIETFETGDVLFAYTEPLRKLKYEVHIDNDDFSGDEETFLLSVHAFNDGKEQDDTWSLVSSHFSISMKLQRNIWRVSKVTVGAEFPIGDPEFVKKVFLDKSGNGLAADSGVAYTPHATVQMDSVGAAASTSTSAPQQVVTLLSYAETTFARMHPDKGFTCSLADLEETSKMMGVDPQVNTGSFNGYHFALTGCESKPSGSYQVVAEPLVLIKGAKAFCTDATTNVRVSEDGRGATCLTSGTPANDDLDTAADGMSVIKLVPHEGKQEQ